LKIKGQYYFDSLEKAEPLIILIHQFKSKKEQWNEFFIDSLIAKGYKVIAYDIRSHGESDKAKVGDMQLLTDKEQAPKDLEAVLKWAKHQQEIDSLRIGIVGTSIGASLAIYGEYFLGAKSIIGISGGKSTFEGLTGFMEALMGRLVQRIPNVLFICGDKDGNYAKDEQYIFDNYTKEPNEIKIFNSEKHGKDLIEQFPEINTMIINWFAKTL
jgi:dienelactone hydrolase